MTDSWGDRPDLDQRRQRVADTFRQSAAEPAHPAQDELALVRAKLRIAHDADLLLKEVRELDRVLRGRIALLERRAQTLQLEAARALGLWAGASEHGSNDDVTEPTEPTEPAEPTQPTQPAQLMGLTGEPGTALRDVTSPAPEPAAQDAPGPSLRILDLDAPRPSVTAYRILEPPYLWSEGA